MLIAHRLTLYVTRDARLASTSTALFVLNPASVFTSAMYEGPLITRTYCRSYSESLYALCSLRSLYDSYLTHRPHTCVRVLMSEERILESSVWIAGAATARSNGNLLVLYLLPGALQTLWALLYRKRGAFVVRTERELEFRLTVARAA